MSKVDYQNKVLPIIYIINEYNYCWKILSLEILMMVHTFNWKIMLWNWEGALVENTAS